MNPLDAYRKARTKSPQEIYDYGKEQVVNRGLTSPMEFGMSRGRAFGESVMPPAYPNAIMIGNQLVTDPRILEEFYLAQKGLKY